MIVTGEEIHRGDIRPVAGTTKVRIVVQGSYTDDEMKERIDQAGRDLRGLTAKTLSELPAGGPVDGHIDFAQASSDQGHHDACAYPEATRRLLERLGKLDEALLDGRISADQYEDMRAPAEQEFGGWEA